MAQEFSKQFYKSDNWIKLRQQILLEREAICSICGKKIIDSKAIQVHHIEELTPENIEDVNISLNPENLQVVCQTCHNLIHGRYCNGSSRKIKTKSIHIVYGSPLAGKSTYVRNRIGYGDLVVDMNRLYMALSYQDIYNKPEQIKYNVMAVRNFVLDNIKTRYGNFNNAWIMGGYANKHDRERLATDLNAELVYIEATKEDCYYRLEFCNDYRQAHQVEWKKYIDEWFETHQE